MTNPHFYSLQVCGFLPSSIMGQDSANAIADWQEAHGLVADGKIGPATAYAMHVWHSPSGDTPHYTVSEYLNGLTVPDKCMPNVLRTLRMCEVLRLIVFGGVPCRINGGARDRAKPRKGGQAKNSLHYVFDTDGVTPRLMAADLTPVVRGSGTDPKDWDSLTKQAMLDGRLSPGGYKTYYDQPESGEFRHTDWRGYAIAF